MINGFWLLDFIINLNRVDFIRKITTCKDSFKVYWRSWLILDLIALAGSVTMAVMGNYRYAKYFDCIRLLRFDDTLCPVYLMVETYNSTG